jgi:DNA-binding NarL/FixJ family response regulator
MQVFIADSSPLLDERLTKLFSELPDLEIVGQSHDLDDAILAISRLKPDFAMIEVHLLGRLGLDLLTAVTRGGEEPFVMMLANDVSPGPTSHTCAGADILLYKPSDLGKTLTIIKRLLQRFQPTNAEAAPEVA